MSDDAPVMTAWLAMTVAAVDRITKGMSAQPGTIRKKGSFIALWSFRMRAPCPR